MNFIKYSKFWFILSGSLVAASLIALLLWGLNPGVDFTGGSLMRLKFSQQALSADQIKTTLSENVSDQVREQKITVQPVGENEVLLKFQATDEPTHQEILTKIQAAAKAAFKSEAAPAELVQEERFDSIGPSIGRELKEKSRLAIIAVLVAIIAYIAWAFRAVSTELNKYESLRYGLIAIVALVHDILITLGVFAVLGRFSNVEVDTFFIAALLTILGYSVNDTIIIFDRIRENVIKQGSADFGQLVNQSVNEVLTRSINTSATTLAVLFSILFFGGQSTFYFILALIIGIICGTYSSIFLASPLLVWWAKRRNS